MWNPGQWKVSVVYTLETDGLCHTVNWHGHAPSVQSVVAQAVLLMGSDGPRFVWSVSLKRWNARSGKWVVVDPANFWDHAPAVFVNRRRIEPVLFGK